MPANYVLLERIELSATTTSVVFNNIPQSGYTDLKVVCSSRATNNNGQYVAMQINALTGNISAKTMYGTGSSSVSSYSSSAQTDAYGDQPDSNFTASTYANTEFYITNYSSASQYKCIYMDGVTEGSSSTAWQLEMGARLSSNNAAVTSLTFTTPNSGSFAQYSTFSLYGLAAAGTTPVIAPKASGGNITTDGTYWYHTFLSSGAFVPAQSLSADVLVIAGGGGGAGDVGGGAGAGGVLYAASKSLTATSYTCTVGAGGVAGNQSGVDPGTNGVDSYFDVLRAFGGAKGTNYGNAGYSGGSGAGCGGGNTGSGGAVTQTSNNGGTGYANIGGSTVGTSGTAIAGGGGGGAGAAGGNNSGGVGGNGGNGLNTWSSWATATGTGVSGFYAGGGGAGGWSATPGTGGSGGGGAGGQRSDGQAATAGTANTGGGGGSDGGGGGIGGAGGSGIVIIRYAMT